jgi:hypothetical protein
VPRISAALSFNKSIFASHARGFTLRLVSGAWFLDHHWTQIEGTKKSRSTPRVAALGTPVRIRDVARHPPPVGHELACSAISEASAN